jgi:hypothetical protein
MGNDTDPTQPFFSQNKPNFPRPQVALSPLWRTTKNGRQQAPKSQKQTQSKPNPAYGTKVEMPAQGTDFQEVVKTPIFSFVSQQKRYNIDPKGRSGGVGRRKGEHPRGCFENAD